ncbi:MAG: hypothetical protein DRP26_02910 [Candidatus Zixiibacteriota bacterium]|nr:MAG: hypothetical protein DRP26_02910 [candidate division Zixibacteria bacterium]
MKGKKINKWLFFPRFLIYFIIAYLLWHFTAPIANKALTFLGGNLVVLFDKVEFTKAIKAVGKYIVVAYEPAKEGKNLVLDYKGFTFNTVFLIALIMAVPNINYKLRLKILVLGLVILYPIQVSRLVIYIFNYYCQNIRRKDGTTIYPTFTHNAIGYANRVLIRIDGQIIPILIWASLFYYYKWHKVLMKKRKVQTHPESK